MIKKLIACVFVVACISTSSVGQGPGPALRTDLIPPAPNAAAFEKYGNIPVTLYNGMANTSVPITQVTDGSLSTSISLSYNYNGCKPFEAASWVGVGWNLNAGGVITRTLRGMVDNTLNPGYNYEDYSIYDSMQSLNNRDFLRQAADYDAYDLQLDLYSYNFNGHSGKFVWYKNKAYIFSREKIKIVHPGESSFEIVTGDGAIYRFETTETTHTKTQVSGYTPDPYISSWYLTEIVSANGKDQISFSYSSPFSYRGPIGPLSETFLVTQGPGDPCPANTKTFSTSSNWSPSIGAIVLQSIDTRNAHIVFDTLGRVNDEVHNYPALGSIKIYNKGEVDTLHLVQQWELTYGDDFGLSLNKVTKKPIDAGTENEDYRFTYETGGYSGATSLGIDGFGYCNGQANSSLFPIEFFPVLAGAGSPANREPSLASAKTGMLKSVRYPTGGSTSFEYELNTYHGDGFGAALGPGLRVRKMVSMDSLTAVPVVKIYRYNLSDTISSGVLFLGKYDLSERSSVEVTINPESAIDCETHYDTYQAGYSTASGSKFYYSAVTEIDSGYNGEIHESQYYYYATLDDWDLMGVNLNTKLVYSNKGNTKRLISRENSSYYGGLDTVFIGLLSTWASYRTGRDPINNNIYSYVSGGDNVGWKLLAQTNTTTFDDKGDSLVAIVSYRYDKYHNLSFAYTTTSTTDTLVSKYKYPENYNSSITGKLLAKNIISSPIETQAWVKKNDSDSTLQGGEIIKYDTTFYKPVEKYYLESQPLTSLDNETMSSGLYTTLLSDSRYVKRIEMGYEFYGNPAYQKLSDNVITSIIWDYNAALPIAQITNGTTDDVGYAGFESFTGGGWTGIAADSVHTDTLNSLMGHHYYHLVSSMTRTGLDAGKEYMVTYWSRNGSLTVNSGSGTAGYSTANGWTMYTHKIVHPSGGTITASGSANIDELRVYPAGAQMTTFAFKPGIGMVGQCDLNNNPVHYYYDGLNRLTSLRDKDLNIIKTIDYHFKGQ